MSGLTGIWNLDGEPVSRELLSAMSARLVHRGVDGENILLSGSAGFAYQMMRVTPQSMTDVQPLADPSGCILMFDGRLDNREEILAGLVRSPGLNPEAPDSALVLAAYHAFGDDFVARLDGDFAFALFHPAKKRLFLARDVMGGRTLYYCKVGNRFLFASEIKALLSHPAVSTHPDEHTLAEWVFRIPDYSEPTRTFFRDIEMVLPGHVHTVDPESTVRRRFWDFDVSGRLRLHDYEEYVEAYRGHFAKAVQRRLRSAFPVALAVSGGLDSSSIYCMAQEIMRHDPSTANQLTAMCLAPDYPAANEAEFQQSIADRYGIQIHKIPITSGPSLEGRGRNELAYNSEGPFIRWQVWRDLARICVQNGARTMMSGHFGDHLLLSPQYLLDLVAEGKWLTAYRHGKKYLNWFDDVPAKENAKALYDSLKGYLVPERLRPIYHRLRRGGSNRQNGLPSLPWYSDRFVATADYVSRHLRPMDVPRGRAHVKILYQYVHSRRFALRADMESKMDAEFPCETAYPFRDRALVQFMMSLPGEIVYQSGSRGIHRDAMKGILPEMVRLRRSKANFDDPAKGGAAQDLQTLWDVLPVGAAARMGYLAPPPALTQALTSLRDQLPESAGAGLSWVTSDLVALESWLATFFSGETGASTV